MAANVLLAAFFDREMSVSSEAPIPDAEPAGIARKVIFVILERIGRAEDESLPDGLLVRPSQVLIPNAPDRYQIPLKRTGHGGAWHFRFADAPAGAHQYRIRRLLTDAGVRSELQQQLLVEFDLRIHDFLLRDRAHICKAHIARGAKQIADATFKEQAETNLKYKFFQKGREPNRVK